MALMREVERNIMQSGKEGNERQLKLALKLRDYLSNLKKQGFSDYPPEILDTLGKSQIKYDPDTRIIQIENKSAHLSPLEDNLLNLFIINPGEIISAEIIAKQVIEDPGNTRYALVLVQRLREKIESDPKIPRIIRTVRGKGYIYGSPTE